MRLSYVVPTLAAIAALPVVAFPAESRVQVASPGVTSSKSRNCHAGNPLRGVQQPDRLIVHTPCTAQTGTVIALVRDAGGEVHISLAGINSRLLLPANQGTLVVDRVPTFPVPLPAVGSQVTVVGPFVTENPGADGWNAVQPLWHLTVHTGRELAAPEIARVPLSPTSDARAERR